MPTKEELEKGFKLGDWEIIPARRMMRRGDEELTPEPKVFGVLMSLALRGGNEVTRDELIDEVWEGRPTGDEPINRCIAQLRGHLGDRRPYRYIKALTGRGYLLQEKIVLNEPDAAQPTADTPAAKSPSRVFRTIIVLVLFAFTVAVIVDYVNRTPESNVHSIGVISFENVSGDDENQYLAEGFKQELMKSLQPLPDVIVKTGRGNYADKDIAEIARDLDVDSVLVGKVNRNGDELKVSYELIRGSDGNSVGGSVTGSVAEFFDLQVEVAEQVRSDLFGNAEQILVSASRPANFEAYDNYLQGSYAFDRRGNGRNLEDAMQLFEETIRMDPSFGPAYLQLATAYTLLPAYRGASLDESNRMAVLAIEQGVEADPSIRDASGAVFGFIYHYQKQWAKAELAYQQATGAIVVDPNAFNWYSRMLASVGRLDAALEQALLAFELDPDSAIITSRVALSYSWVDQAEKADEFFERARRLGDEGTTHLLGWALFLAREGRTDEASEITKIAASHGGIPTEWIDPWIAGMLDEEMKVVALEAVNETAEAGQLPPQIEVVVRTLMGDIDGAMRVAELLEQPGEAFEMDLLWIPEFEPLRMHSDFPGLMERLGIAEHWRLHGCTFDGSKVSCPEDPR